MPQFKVVYLSQQLLGRTMPGIRQQINQSLLLVLKMETSQHNPHELESPGSMNVNEVAMPQYKQSEVFMLQDKSKSITNERVMSQHVQSLKQLCLKINHHLKNQPSMSEMLPMQNIK